MSLTRFDMRLDDAIKLKAEKAAALLGLKSLTEYVSKLMDEVNGEMRYFIEKMTPRKQERSL